MKYRIVKVVSGAYRVQKLNESMVNQMPNTVTPNQGFWEFYSYSYPKYEQAFACLKEALEIDKRIKDRETVLEVILEV